MNGFERVAAAWNARRLQEGRSSGLDALRSDWVAELSAGVAVCAFHIKLRLDMFQHMDGAWMLKRTTSQGILMADPPHILSIGELAHRTGLATSALRYYERVGLLSPASRKRGRRYYDISSAERVALIQLFQEAGCTLQEIRALVSAGTRRGHIRNSLVEAKLRDLEIRIAQTEHAKSLVQYALACPHSSLLECQMALKKHLGSLGRDPAKLRAKKRPATVRL
jgi:DNA-binding transcriptional MerR regulator